MQYGRNVILIFFCFAYFFPLSHLRVVFEAAQLSLYPIYKTVQVRLLLETEVFDQAKMNPKNHNMAC